MTAPFGYVDICDDGLLVVAEWMTSRLHFGETVVIAPDFLMFVRATIGPEGKHYAVGKGHASGTCWLVCEDGRAALDLGLTFGNYSQVISPSDTGVIVSAQTAPDQATMFAVDVAAWQKPIGVIRSIAWTSQGFADAGARPEFDLPLLNDPIDRQLCGADVRYPSVRGSRFVAQATVAAQMLIGDTASGSIGTLLDGTCYEPHFSTSGAYWCCRGDAVVSFGPTPVAIPPLLAPPIVVPTFPPRRAYVCVVNDDASPLTPYRTTTVSETAAQQADPRTRAVYLEAGDDPAPVIAVAVARRLDVIQNIDNAKDLTAAQCLAIWQPTAEACAQAGVAFHAAFEAYPNLPIAVQTALLAAIRSQGWHLAPWLAAYRGVQTTSAPYTYAWTPDEVLTSQTTAVALMPDARYFLLFEAVRGAADGVAAFPWLQAALANLLSVCAPPAPVPSPVPAPAPTPVPVARPVTQEELLCLVSRRIK